MSRLEELRNKYPLCAGLDPYPFRIYPNDPRRYNNGGPDIFRPRARYEQRFEEYLARWPSPGHGREIVVIGGVTRSVKLGSPEWPVDDE